MAGICGAIHRSLLLLCLLSFVDLLLYADALCLIGFLILILTLGETLEGLLPGFDSLGILAQPTVDIAHMVVHIGRSLLRASLREGLALVELGERIVLTQEEDIGVGVEDVGGIG